MKTVKGTVHPEPADPLSLCIQLFLDGFFVRVETARGLLSATESAALLDLGLLTKDTKDESLLYSPIKLYPVDPVHVASDRWSNPDGSPFKSLPDILYPPVGPNTKQFLEVLPDSPCEAFLDLCSGTGVAGLIAASQYARQAAAYDITERCAHFAEFSRRLNALENFTTGTGDLYEPAAAQTFDRIVAHPPYVPVIEPKWIFYGGGEDGEQITRRIIAGLPRYLRPGGALHCLAMVTERKGESLEHRVRQWLGGGEHGFDIAVVTRKTLDPGEFAVGSVLKQGGKLSDTLKFKTLFRELKVTALTYAMIMVQRSASPRSTFTVRRQSGPRTSRAEHEWLLGWETAAAESTGNDLVLQSRLRASAHCELLALNRIQDGDWAAVGYKLQVDYPFDMEMRMEPWVGLLLPRCNGTLTGAEVFAALKKDGVLHAATPLGEFAALLRVLISGGFLLIVSAAAGEVAAGEDGAAAGREGLTAMD
ncbi:MAG TPA: class I SAM-dependent methyltransferase [Candidatus Acidoferrum sp.]|nr:class I SAM-dependent methyltransferase [Candidatus Acidoferrum sp.]